MCIGVYVYMSMSECICVSVHVCIYILYIQHVYSNETMMSDSTIKDCT